MILKIFNYISYFRYVAYLWGAYVAFPEIIERTNNIIANVGFGLFLFGIGIALEGFKDSDRKFTKVEIKLYSNEKRIKRMIVVNSLFQCFAVLFGVFCFNLNLFYPDVSVVILAQFRELGFGSLAAGIGGISLAKEQYNRFKAFTNLA